MATKLQKYAQLLAEIDAREPSVHLVANSLPTGMSGPFLDPASMPEDRLLWAFDTLVDAYKRGEINLAATPSGDDGGTSWWRRIGGYV